MSRTTAPFPITPEEQAIAIAYRNPAYIADEVMPRVPVGKQEFKWLEYPVEESFTIPDTRVGRRGQPTVVELTAQERTSSTYDYGLDDTIPQSDITDAPAGYDPVGRAVEQLTDYVLLDREVRTAAVVFGAATYPAGNKITLAGASQLSDAAADSLGVINTALDAPLMRPNVGVIGHAAWSVLRRNAKLVRAVKGTDALDGMITVAEFVELFELERLIIGQSRLNTARRGQAANLTRVWGKHLAFLHVNRIADTRSGLTFGYTAQYGQRVSGRLQDPDIGLRGGTRVRVGESVREVVAAARAGYLIENVVA